MLCKFQLLYLYDQLILVAAPQVWALLVGMCSFPKQKEWDFARGRKHCPDSSLHPSRCHPALVGLQSSWGG